MSAKQRPWLFRSGLTGRIYISTSYKVMAEGRIISNTKFDVTEEFEAIEHERERERFRALATSQEGGMGSTLHAVEDDPGDENRDGAS